MLLHMLGSRQQDLDAGVDRRSTGAASITTLPPCAMISCRLCSSGSAARRSMLATRPSWVVSSVFVTVNGSINSPQHPQSER